MVGCPSLPFTERVGVQDLLRSQPSFFAEEERMAIKPDQQEQYIAIWAKAVETQMHFNEMSVKSRQLGLTFVAAALGVGIVLLTRGDTFSIPLSIGGREFQLHVAVLLLAGACLGLNAVRGLDLNVYHKMLRGAVTFGEDFEEHYMKKIFKLNKGMTQAISHFSRFEDAGKTVSLPSKKYRYTGTIQVTAEDKIRAFYRNTLISLIVGTIALFIATNIAKPRTANDATQPPSISNSENSSLKR
jgi:hypothetical protein